MDHSDCNCSSLRDKIEYNRGIALFRLRNKNGGKIEDLFFSPNVWPHHLIRIFWNLGKVGRECGHLNRMKLVLFFWRNGINFNNFEDYIQYYHRYNINFEKRYLNEMKNQMNYFDNIQNRVQFDWENKQRMYYFYSLIIGHEIFLDNHLRTNGKRGKKLA